MTAFQKVWRLALRSPALRQSAVAMVGTGLTGALMAAAMIMASRFMGPIDFGIFSVAIAIMMILTKGTDLGLNQLFPRLLNQWHTQPEIQENFLAQMVKWRVILSVVTMVIGVMSIPMLMQWLDFPHMSILVLAVLGAVLVGWYEHGYLLLSARHKFVSVAVMSVLQAVLKLVVFAGLFFSGFGTTFLISLIYFISPFVSLLVVAQLTRFAWLRKAVPTHQAVSRAIRRFWPHAAVGSIAITLINNVDVLLVQGSLNSLETGLYAGATRLASFVVLITYAVSSVLNNRVSRYRTKADLRSYLWKSLSLVGLSFVGFLFFVPIAREIMWWTIGPEYLAGLVPFIILMANALLGFALVPYTSYFFAVDAPSYHSIGGVIQVVIIVGGNMLYLQSHGLLAAAGIRLLATIIFALYTAFMIALTWKKVGAENS